MDQIKSQVIDRLRKARSALLGIPKGHLTGYEIQRWHSIWLEALAQADTISGQLLPLNINRRMQGFWRETNHDICIDLRSRIIELIDGSIKAIDMDQKIKPILDELILKVADPKLAAFLREFNETRTAQPNIASAGFRTIICLVIRERAKRVNKTGRLATKEDIAFEADIKAALAENGLFNEAETKLLRRYLQGGDKDSFDNVVHKADYLIDKSELDDAVGLLNHLLPSITD